jgi:alkylation response protein AidB-like acyl-CoA dehydrogenase
MKIIDHPSAHIAPELANALRKLAGDAEMLKKLHPAQMEIIQEQKWFQLFVPRQYGGLQLNLLQALQLEEAIAWTDGSVGWTVTLCAGAGWFVGFLNPGLAASVFDGKKVCLAGSGKASGIATKIKGGFEISGYWDYATGSHCATAFTANCSIKENGLVLKNEAGDPLIQSFLFLRNEVRVHDNWKRIGMIATGSNSFEVSQLVVDESRSFLIDPQYAILKDPVYRYPFLQFAESTLAINHSGMAMRFLDLCKLLFALKSTPAMQQLLYNSIKEMEAARQLFYNTISASWESVSNHFSITAAILQHVSTVSKQLAFTCRNVVDALYPCCGMQAANPDTEISRVWRNLHTATQHGVFNS